MSSTARPAANKGPLGILGGTFDPVHTAHLRLAEEAVRQLGLVEVVWIPAGDPRHRAAPQATGEHRLAMVQRAIDGHPRYSVDAGELRSGEPSYTVPTLERLRRTHGEARPLVLLLGADAFLGLAGWHRWAELFGLAHLAVVSRPGFPLRAEAMPPPLRGEFAARRDADAAVLARAPAGAIVPYVMEAGTVSSTEVRTRLRAGEPADELLPAAVLDYIRRHRLYLT
jgi:nicotinate-nucleotide adenylyltransferase